jgi:hypothetical protein
MKTYASFSDWKNDQTPRNRRLITALTRVIEGVDDAFTKTVKWGQGCWTKDEVPRVYIHAEPDHVQLGFYRGTDLKDPRRILEGKGKHVRFVRISPEEDIRTSILANLIKQVV